MDMSRAVSYCPICELPLETEAYTQALAESAADKALAEHLMTTHQRVMRSHEMGADVVSESVVLEYHLSI